MIKSRADKNRAIVEDPICCQQCVISCRLYDTGNGQLGGVRPVDIIPGFILPGITLVLDAQLVSGCENRFNQRFAIRLEALIIFIRSGVIIVISPQGQNRIPCQQRLCFLVRNAGICGNAAQFVLRQGADDRIQRSFFCILHQVRNVRIETVALDPDIGKHLAGLDLVGRHGIDIGQINCGGNLFHPGQCSEVIL